MKDVDWEDDNAFGIKTALSHSDKRIKDAIIREYQIIHIIVPTADFSSSVELSPAYTNRHEALLAQEAIEWALYRLEKQNAIEVKR